MRDLMMEMYTAFQADELLAEHVEEIKFFDYPNANDINEPIIVIDDLSSPIPDDYSDNQPLTYINIYQIDLFVKQNSNINGRLLSGRLILRVQEIMWKQFGFHTSMAGKPDYNKDFNLYRQTISFTGKNYINEMEKL